MRRRSHDAGYLLGLALALVSLASAALAQSAAPKGNGKIAFVSSRTLNPYHENSGISVMNPDGSGRAHLTVTQIVCPQPNRPPGYGCGPDQLDYSPSWSPDGRQIAFIRSVPELEFSNDNEIFVMNADGSNQRRLTQVSYVDRPSWSPDGTRIAFSGPHLGDYYIQVYVMNADGSGHRPIGRGIDPAWSPDGSRLAFSYYGLHLMNPDGSGRTQITAPQNPSPNLVDYDWGPAWSPDGTRIVFSRSVNCDWAGGCESTTTWTVNADGSNPAKLADIEAYGRHAWSPDGTKIVFSANGDLFTIGADGGNVTNITNTPGESEWLPSWQAVALAPPVNPIDDPQFFVRQHYLDFLNREPDPLAAEWVNLINSCSPGDTSCDRIHVSEAFFKSPEFQERGYFLYRFYPVSFGRKPDYAEFIPDLQRVCGFLTPAELEVAKTSLVNDFIARNAFKTKYESLSNQTYVEELLATAGVSLSNRQALIDGLNSGGLSRGQVLRQVVESNEVYQNFYNQAFVVMQYFGYLRRDPDILYLNWIATLDANPSDSRHMIAGFVNSIEYRQRFGP